MDEKTERLNDSAKKAKRNLLFFTMVAWALAVEWIEVTADKIPLGGVGANTSLEVILWFLFAMLVYPAFPR